MTTERGQPCELPLQTRLAPITTIDVDARTVECIWTTGATVRRTRWSGWDTVVPFDEELVVSDEAIDLSRLKLGAPLLDSHAAWSLDMVRGVVEKAWLVDGKGYAILRFPEKGTDEKADRLFELVRQNIIRNISVGYSINQARIIEPEKKGEIERRIIERWTPHELSFVTIPADPKAQVRSDEVRTFPVAIIGRAIPTAISPAEIAAARLRMTARGAGLPA